MNSDEWKSATSIKEPTSGVNPSTLDHGQIEGQLAAVIEDPIVSSESEVITTPQFSDAAAVVTEPQKPDGLINTDFYSPDRILPASETQISSYGQSANPNSHLPEELAAHNQLNPSEQPINPIPHTNTPADATSVTTSTISNPALEVDSVEFSDTDSAISAFREESTQSVRSSLYDYVEENGRTFHRYKEGKYVLPNDEKEQDRLDLQHQMLLILLDGKLSLAPIGLNPQNVLDVGTGTGIWAIEFATRYPSANIIGTDLSPIQPQFVPPNCQFEVDDAEDEWIFSNKFDFIHMRGMMTCFSDPRSILAKACEAIEPGGYLEMQDSVFPMYCHDDSLLNTPLDIWAKACVEAAKILGRPWTNTPNYKGWMEELGFEDVKEKIFEVPTSTWPKGRKAKELGLWWQADLLDALGASMAVLTRGLGWSPEAVERLLVDVRTCIRDRNVHAFMPIHVVYGRKPGSQKGSLIGDPGPA